MKSNPIDFLNDLKNWRPYKKGLCDQCIGLCCYMPVEATVNDLIRMKILDEFHLEMSLEEQVKIAIRNPAINRFTKSSMKFTLNQRPNQSCFFLDQSGRCRIYEKRPDTCRNHPKIGPKPNYCAFFSK